MNGIGAFEPEFYEDRDALPGLWEDALSGLRRATMTAAGCADEVRLRVVLSRMAKALTDLDSTDTDPAIWLQVHHMERSLRSAEPSPAAALMDKAMLLLAEYLDLMGESDAQG